MITCSFSNNIRDTNNCTRCNGFSYLCDDSSGFCMFFFKHLHLHVQGTGMGSGVPVPATMTEQTNTSNMVPAKNAYS